MFQNRDFVLISSFCWFLWYIFKCIFKSADLLSACERGFAPLRAPNASENPSAPQTPTTSQGSRVLAWLSSSQGSLFPALPLSHPGCGGVCGGVCGGPLGGGGPAFDWECEIGAAESQKQNPRNSLVGVRRPCGGSRSGLLRVIRS